MAVNINNSVKASIGFFLARIVCSGIGFITTPIFTRILCPEDFGVVAVFLTWSQLLGIIAMFNLSCGVFNNGMLDYPDHRDEYSFSMLGLSNLITLVFSILFLSLHKVLEPYLGIDLYLSCLLCLQFLTLPAYLFWLTRQRYELKYKAPFVWSVICAAMAPLIAIISITLFPSNKVHARLFGGELPLIIIYIGFAIYLAQKSSFKCDTKYWKGAILFNLPLLPHYLSVFMLSSSDRLMISRLDSNEHTAYYSVAYSIASIAVIAWGSVNSSLVPYTYENCKGGNYKKIADVVKPLITIFAAASILGELFGPEMIRILGTECYYDAVYVIPPIVSGVFFQVLYYIFANIIFYHKQTKYVMYASVLATIINISLNYFLIPIYGYVAAGYTTLISYLCQAVLNYKAMKHIANRSIYDMKHIMLISLSVLMFSFITLFLYDYPVIRYSTIGGLLVFSLINRERIISVLRFVRKK